MHNKLLSLFMLLVMLGMGTTAQAETVTEDGITWQKVYFATEFKAAVEANQNIWLQQDIDLSQIKAVEDDMIFDYDLKFTGRIRGDYNDLNGEQCAAVLSNSPYMLFKEIENAHFTNLIFSDCKFIGWDSRSGQLAAEATNCEFTNIILVGCSATGDRNSCDCDQMGGLIGIAHGCSFDSVLAMGCHLITDGQNAGLIVGKADGSTFKYCATNAVCSIWADGNSEGAGILENAYCGGICGYSSNSTFDSCVNMALVSAADDTVGGIVGYGDKTTLTNCQNTGMVCHNTMEGYKTIADRLKYASWSLAAGTPVALAAISTYAGLSSTIAFYVSWGYTFFEGFVATVTTLAPVYGYAIAAVAVIATTITIAVANYDPDEMGGIAGTITNGSSVRACSNYGFVDCFDAYVGGIVGHADGSTIEQCLNQAAISGDEQAGSIAGYIKKCTLRNNLSIGSVRANSDRDNIVGEAAGDNNTRNNNYFLGSEDKDYGVTHSITQQQLASGEIAMKLNQAIGSSVFRQNLGKSIYPTLSANDPEVTATIEVTEDMLWQKVSNVVELTMALCNPDAKIELTEDINMAGRMSFCNFTKDMPFRGEIKGNGHKLMNCSYSAFSQDTEVDAALISYASGAEFSDFIIDNFHITQNDQILGHHTHEAPLVAVSTGCKYDHVSVRNSSIKKNSDDDWLEYVGGLVALSTNDEFVYCIADNSCKFEGFSGNSNKDTNVGGLVGYAVGSTFENCINASTIKADDDNDGGIVGYITGGKIDRCLNLGHVEGQDYVGGMAGRAFNTKITRCVNTGTITGDDSNNKYLGGIVGSLKGSSSYLDYCLGFGSILNAATGYFCCVYGECEDYPVLGLNNKWNCTVNGTNQANVEIEKVLSGSLAYFTKDSDNERFLYQSIDNGGWYTNYPVPFPEAGEVFCNHDCQTNKDTYSNIYEQINKHDAQLNKFGICEVCGGVGTPSAKTISVEDADDMVRLAYAVEKGLDFTDYNIDLDNDIDFSTIDANTAYRFYGIGTATHPFKGTFDGQGHTIKNLKYEKAWGAGGLFPMVGGNTTIKDVVLDNTCYLRTGCYAAGGIVGVTLGESTLQIKKCGFEGYVSGASSVGSMLGMEMIGNTNVTISHCYNTGKVDGTVQSAAMCGFTYDNISIISSWNTGTVSGVENNQPFVGFSTSFVADRTFTDCCDVNTQEGITRVSSEDLSSGNMCYLLNGEVSGKNSEDAWYQKIGDDALPTLNYRTDCLVYNHNYRWCDDMETILSYYDNEEYPKNNVIKHDFDDNGICMRKTGEVHGEECDVIDGSWSVSKMGHLYYIADQVNSGEEQYDINLLDNLVDNNAVFINGALSTYTEGFRQWTPIGNEKRPFTKSFYGNYHTISGLYVNPTTLTSVAGLLGMVLGNASISNVGITDSYFNNAMYVGAIAGFAQSTGDGYPCISGCYASGGAVNVKYYGGGILGAYKNDCNTLLDFITPITDCYNTCSVLGNDQYTGGILGATQNTIGLTLAAYTYYLDDCTEGTSGYGETKSALAFRTGEVLQLLNNGQNGMWSQALDKQQAPVFGDGNVSYSRTVTAGNWGSLILPFPVTLNENVQYYTYKSIYIDGYYDNAKLSLQSADEVPANTPCFFRTSAGCDKLSVTAAANRVVAPSGSQVTITMPNNLSLIGSYDDLTISSPDQNVFQYYYVAQNKVWWAEEAFNLPAFRSYIKLSHSSNSAKSLDIVVDDDATAINQIVNGTLSNCKWYNLNGQRVNPNTKGIVIKNGQKILNK